MSLTFPIHSQILSVENPTDWQTYLDMMWQANRAADNLPKYTRADFDEPGSYRLIYKQNEVIHCGLYARIAPQHPEMLYVHRWTTWPDGDAITGLLAFLELQALGTFKTIATVIKTTEEQIIFKERGYLADVDHQNSSLTEPLQWMVKTLAS